MQLDRQKLKEVLDQDYSFYRGPGYQSRNDDRLHPWTRDFIASQFTADMRVLDIGCGDGRSLLEHHDKFGHGVGIDNDTDHIASAEANKKEQGVTNLDFILLPAVEIPTHLDKESFDFVFSERGPLGGTNITIQAALHVLKPDGLIFSETIGELHHQEVHEVFGEGERRNQTMTTLDQTEVALERNGVSIRVNADIVSKRYYPDIYEWLKFQCQVWAYIDYSPPPPDDYRYELFAERNTNAAREIETTHHVAWSGGVKLENAPNYWEYQHFGS